MTDPWDIVGWMVVGTLAGITLASLGSAISTTLSEITSTRWGRRGLATSVILMGFTTLYFWAPRWVGMVILMLTIAITMAVYRIKH